MLKVSNNLLSYNSAQSQDNNHSIKTYGTLAVVVLGIAAKSFGMLEGSVASAIVPVTMTLAVSYIGSQVGGAFLKSVMSPSEQAINDEDKNQTI